jgi:cysteine desulfurase/selenocysteine lyase
VTGGDIDTAWTPEVLRQQFPILQREVNNQPLRYLDNAATTFSPQCVLEAVADFECKRRSNVQRGMHQLGAEATEAYEAARASSAAYLNAASPDEIVFTSGTTFAVNLVAQCLGPTLDAGDEIVVTVAEHHSNFVPWQRLCEQRGLQLKLIPVLANGCLDLSQLDQLITERCRVVAVSHISNVTGGVTDVQAIASAARRHGALIFVDGAQATPHGTVDVQALGVDFYAFSGHKCYGPTGIGVLWGREGLWDELPPFLTGGGMIERVTAEATRYLGGNRRFEAGTPPVAQAIGLGAALEWLMALPWPEIRHYEGRLTQQMLQGLSGVAGLNLVGEASGEHRAPIFSFDIEGCHSHDICQVLDDYGVALRGGHHCAQPLMDALGLVSTTRASLGVFNNEQDIRALIDGLHRAVEILR